MYRIGIKRKEKNEGREAGCCWPREVAAWRGGAGSDGVVMGHAGARAGGQSRPGGGPGLADSPLTTVG